MAARSNDNSYKSSSTSQQLESELNEVTYVVINVNKSKSNEPIHELSIAINVRLSLEANQNFPFIKFDDFDNLLNEEKVFLYGSSGSGKSRGLFELVKKSIMNTNRIYVINPRHNVGKKSGRIPLEELVDRIGESDTILWDNFPDNLERRDLANARRVLELLSSKSVGRLIVVLKPKYLELFRDLPNQIPEFFVHEITFNKDQFKKIIQQYGTEIPRFSKIYGKYISSNLNRISHILWSKEPTPLTVFDYYNELMAKDEAHTNLNSIKEAETLLRSTNYYHHQFGVLSSMEERRIDAEFLCVLKMCYELGIDRTESNISQLQRSIFGNEAPKEAFNKLSNWLYISAQHYAMHDVCREAVRLSDYVRMKMLSYISENFDAIKEDSDQALNLLGLFIGRNIQFVPLRSSSEFLPDRIYANMKKNGALERSIGFGVGEVFESLDDDLRNILLNKCDTDLIFGMGMAEGLAQCFILLDVEQRRLVLQKIFSGFLFARFFGKTLGLLFRDLDPDVRTEILHHIDSNSQFADGVGMGIGQILDSLDEELRQDIAARANRNIALTRGMGFALASNIGFLDEGQRKQIYARTENNFQLDVGLSFGIAAQYTTLTKELQSEALRRCNDHNGFAKGFGLYLILYTLDKCPPEVLAQVEKNGELAYSLGFGFGWVFPYLTQQFNSRVKTISKENNRFERGFGFGTGLILRHLPENDRSSQFAAANTRSEFDYGLGSGIGFTWNYQSIEDKEAAYARCNTNNSFAQGLGYGHGYAFHYLSEDEKSELFRKVQTNSQLDSGLGYGLGWSFPYSDDAMKNTMLKRAKTYNFFALGLGAGLGQLYRYFPKEIRASAFSLAVENGWFARGFGIGLGRYAIAYLDKELQDEIFLKSNDNTEFAQGLGEGLGREFKFFDSEFQRRILDVHAQNPFLSKGLGIGFGLSYEYLAPDFQSNLYKRAKENVHFALGLGEGIGGILPYLDDLHQRKILQRAISGRDAGYTRGLGVGLGRILNFLNQDLTNELLLQRAKENPQLGIGLGKGAGSVFAYLPASSQNNLLKLSTENVHFALGLGEGIGSIIFILPPTEQDRLFSQAAQNASFAKGIGIGVGMLFSYYQLKTELQRRIFSLLKGNLSIAEGFGIGIGIVLPYLARHFQNKVYKLAEKNASLVRTLGFSLGHGLPTIKLEPATARSPGSDIPQKPEFEYGLGAGAGHNFPFLNVETQGQILNKALNAKEFGKGFGMGLAKSFKSLDNIIRKEILKQAKAKDTEFSYSLGYGLGCALPSTNELLLKELLNNIVNDNSAFARGFEAGIPRSLRYLDKESLAQISELFEQNRSSGMDSSNRKLAAEDRTILSSLEKEFPYDYFVEFGLNSYPDSDNESLRSSMLSEELAFSGESKKCCICFIDMISSTKVASQLDKTQLSKYYSIFINSMATIIRNFDGKIIKNAGDALIYYFPETAVAEPDPSKFRDVFECGITMVAAHTAINSRMQEENLPPINYRISADYGLVEIAKSQSSQSEDLFGSIMNVCAKINSKALPNGMIIGEELYNAAQSLAEEYAFKPAGEITLDFVNKATYPLYHVENKTGKRILQPFKHKLR
jgi:class 3 adenylate cyclase